MLLNEFPKSLIERTITKTLHNHNNKKKENENENMIRMYIPYEKGISENISRVCRKFNVQLVHTRNKSLNNMVKVKTSQNEDTENVSGVVYKVHCNDCEKCYIGETGRMVKTRMKEHKQDAENKKENVSGLSQHIRQTKHKMKFNEVQILNRENNKEKRRFKEAVAIKNSKIELVNKKEEIKVLSEVWENML